MFNVSVEYLWAELLGDNLFRLDNIPFYTTDAAADDIIQAYSHRDDSILQEIDGIPVYHFFRIQEPSGNATAHVLALGIRDRSLPLEEDPSYKPFVALHDAIRPTVCTFEGADRPPCYLTAIDIPPAADRASLRALLEAGAAAKHWIYSISDE